MRLSACTAILALSWLPAVPAWGTDAVRVLLVQNARQIAVSGEQGVAVTLPNGGERSWPGSLEVKTDPGGRGLTLNGELVPAEALVIKGHGGGSLTLTADAGPLTVSGILLVRKPFRAAPGVMVINHVELEDYVKGVVPSEMHSAWHAEALKVQAILARTYVLYQHLSNAAYEYDVVASTQDQVYRGRHGVDERIDAAVDATRGLIVTYANAPILAAFSSTAAGATEDAMVVWSKDLPYLKGVDCPFDLNSPYYRWKAEFALQDLEDTLKRQGYPVGTLAGLTPQSYSGTGRVASLRLLHSQGELILRGEDLRRLVGYTVIPSTQFEIETIGKTVVLSGRGAGHAVGLCQWGAKEMAGLGYSYATILRYYYPGTEVTDLRSMPPAVSALP
jgi:stage II sporulation protein D